MSEAVAVQFETTLWAIIQDRPENFETTLWTFVVVHPQRDDLPRYTCRLAITPEIIDALTTADLTQWLRLRAFTIAQSYYREKYGVDLRPPGEAPDGRTDP